MLFNIELICTSDVPSELDTAIAEINQVLTTIIKFKILTPDLLKILYYLIEGVWIWKKKLKQLITCCLRKANWRDKTNSLIIFVHGLAAYIDDEPFYNASQFFPKHGFATARISLYSHWKNARKVITSTINDHASDIETVINHFKKQFKEICLIGHSLGCPSILLANLQGVNRVILWEPSNPDSKFKIFFLTIGRSCYCQYAN